ncbi:MAG: hypothetical protein GX575_25800 [Candidatus Anammoximicrobium sp.]|nr:hypothetical protein [Candidatus Anammoximicrobium sp.]
MNRRGSRKPVAAAPDKTDGQTQAEHATARDDRPPPRPRRGNHWLLGASALLFLAWLAVLAWLAFR